MAFTQRTLPAHLSLGSSLEAGPMMASSATLSPFTMQAQDSTRSATGSINIFDEATDDLYNSDVFNSIEVGSLMDAADDDIVSIAGFLEPQEVGQHHHPNVKTEPNLPQLVPSFYQPASFSKHNMTTLRIAGHDSTNTRGRKVAPAKSPLKKENALGRAAQVQASSAVATASVSTKKASRKAKAPRDSDSSKPARKTKRTKMPVEEQKRRNCESAKRSRIKKQMALQAATARAEEAEKQNKLLRERFEKIRDWGYKMGMHLATHKDCKDCTVLRQQQQLEQLLSSPVGSPHFR